MKVRMLLAMAALAVPGFALAQGGMEATKPETYEQPGAVGMEAGKEARAALEMSAQDQKKLFQAKDKFELKGTVQSIDASHAQITLERTNLPPAELFVVTEQTKIKLNGKEASLVDIQPGAEVRARFQIADDRPVALELDVKHKAGEKTYEVEPKPGMTP